MFLLRMVTAKETVSNLGVAGPGRQRLTGEPGEVLGRGGVDRERRQRPVARGQCGQQQCKETVGVMLAEKER